MPATTPDSFANRTARFAVLGAALLALSLLVPKGAATHADGAQGGPDGCISFHYVIAGTNYTSIPASLTPGAIIEANFTLGDCSHTVSFVAYNATAGFPLPPQTVFSSSAGDFGPGDHSLSITVPPCYYQIDFVYGDVITQFNETSGTYHGDDRFIGGSQGGSACQDETSSSTSSTSSSGTTTTEVPFFPSLAALSVGLAGAGVSALLLLRRKA